VALRKSDKEYEEQIFSYLKDPDFLSRSEDWDRYAYDIEHLSELKAQLKREDNLRRLAEIKDKIVLDAEDIRDIFDCGQRQAYEIMNLESFPSFRLGSKLQVYRRSLEEWLNDQKYRQINL
jgi:hypothetical protein